MNHNQKLKKDSISYNLILIVLSIICLLVNSSQAQEGICAKVKIEIQQELALERQAFDARMLITNGLTDFSLENLKIDVIFKDSAGNLVTATSDPNNLSALFFITISSLNGTTNVNGSGVIAPSSSAEIHWLIIPSSDAAQGSSIGTLYYVSAIVSYTTNGDPTQVEVAPDFITVFPQPKLTLDYFLPADVYGDDPLTPQTEPIVPFTLGVRVKNTGLGVANKTKITSSQPKIVENLQNLLINFNIIGSYINDQPTQPTLQLNFGDIDPGSSKVGRWLMQTTLAGKFVSFDAQFSHSDELGGALTSLLEQVNTHTLVKDVLVDLPGRDTVRDFLTIDPATYRVFESEGLDNVVNNQSALVLITPTGVDTFNLSIPPTAGMLFVSIPDPFQGTKAVISVVRDDSKVLSAENAWFYTKGLGTSKQFLFGLFDSNGGGTYQIKIGTPQGATNSAPIFNPISTQKVMAGKKLTFDVTATDPDNTIPFLSSDILPLGSSFTLSGKGTGHFEWKTKADQVGNYLVTFKASDGSLTTTQNVSIKVLGPTHGEIDPQPGNPDADHDGLLDAWELENFGDLTQNKDGDFDGDTLSNGKEFRLGLDPTWAPNAPSVPFIKKPFFGTVVKSLQPRLVVESSAHGVQVPSYEFELSKDISFREILASQRGVKETSLTTEWKVPFNLSEGVLHFWRVRAALPKITTEWVYGAFVVDSKAVIPSAFPIIKFPTPTPTATPSGTPIEKLPIGQQPTVENPANKARVDSLQPKLIVLPTSITPPASTLANTKFHFEVYADKQLNRLIDEGVTKSRIWKTSKVLKNYRSYFWRVRAEFKGGAHSKWSKVRTLFTSKDGVNNPPRIELIYPVGDVTIQQGDSIPFIWTAADPDSDIIPGILVNSTQLPGFNPTEPVLGGNDYQLFNNISAAAGNYQVGMSAKDDLVTVIAPNSCSLKVLP